MAHVMIQLKENVHITRINFQIEVIHESKQGKIFERADSSHSYKHETNQTIQFTFN